MSAICRPRTASRPCQISSGALPNETPSPSARCRARQSSSLRSNACRPSSASCSSSGERRTAISASFVRGTEPTPEDPPCVPAVSTPDGISLRSQRRGAVGCRDVSASASVPTRFPELNEFLADFVGRVRSILGANLVGVYLVGSFALRGGDVASDCDFLAVTVDQVGEEQERALRQLHEAIPDWPGYWAYNLEGSYAPKADLGTLGALGQPWLYVNRGGRSMEWSA